MPLKLLYITNRPEVALIAQENGVDRVMVDMETLGKEERQKNMNTVKSHHTLSDVQALADVLDTTELMVRINPWNEKSGEEIESVISAGAERIMLPMWKTVEEVTAFLQTVDRRVGTTLLLETAEAVEILDEVLSLPLLDEIHVGLNDLHLSYGKTFMFELLADGTVEQICKKCKAQGVLYGFGGIARIGEGTLPSERILMEHYRLGSNAVILSRSFCNAEELGNVALIRSTFEENMKRLRACEQTMNGRSHEFLENQTAVCACVAKIVTEIRGK